jgi:hypothetical protein
MNLGETTFSLTERLKKIEDNEKMMDKPNEEFRNLNNSLENQSDDLSNNNFEPPQFLKKKYIENNNQNDIEVKSKFYAYQIVHVLI